MKKLITILLLAVFAFSCKMGKNYKGTDVYIPESYAQADTSLVVASDTINTDTLNIPTAAELNWWDLFDDPALDTLIKTAIRQNRSALIAAENILQARYGLKIQNAEFLPKFSIDASAQRGNFLLNQIGDVNNLFIGAAQLNWELDFWGKYRRLSEAARADLMTTEYGYRSIMMTLISDVSATYFRLLQAKSQLEISKRNEVARDSMLTIIKERYDKGIIAEIDVNQAEIQKAIAAGAVPQYERQVIQLQNALSILLGKNPGPINTGKTLKEQRSDIEIPLITPTELLARRPDVIAAEYALIGQNARVGAAQANRLPSISVNALLGVAGNDFTQLSFTNPLWNIGGQLVGPLFYWGQLKRLADIEKSKRYQALFRYENTVFNALREVEDALAEIRTTKREIEIGEGRVVSALNAQNLSRERYSKGVTSYLEFLEQQRQAFDAELLLEGYRAYLLSSYVRLYKALGGGWITQNEKSAAAQQKQ